ncbi:MAG: molecular chaperone HtpG, partial [Lachnospiraceae bacterium]|nr:molecular chaperone HtpG [Lachnospiraceae bacterium]
KYKDKTNEDQMIGHFGLGFYSAFMVADEVHIETLSYQEGATPVHWESSGETTYQIGEGSREEVGTTITLFLNDDSLEFANEYRMREVLGKYCAFMPYPIYLRQSGVAQEYQTIDEADLRDDDVVIEHIQEDGKDKVKINKRRVALNDIHPLWAKHPNDCSDDDYKEFFRKVFLDYKEPLFWIHLNMDYPFNLKGILYFPKINTEYDSIEGTIKLYNNQVFIADNIPEVVPDFLKLLKGVIDCPDLPLNVSRSALQNDGFVKKISDYITKKIADKLTGMCKTDREHYEKHWDDIAPFVKYGCLRDDKFCERLQDYILFKDLDDKYLTLKEYMDKNGLVVQADEDTDDEEKDSEKKQDIYYVTDPIQQSQYIKVFKSEGLDAVYLTHSIDTPFISQLEQKNKSLAFKRIDAQIDDSLKADETDDKATEAVSSVFKKALGKDNLLLKVENLKDDSVASILVTSEEGRRMQDMMRMYGIDTGSPDMLDNDATLIVNANHPLVQYITEHKRSKNSTVICKQLYDMARIANHPLSPEEMSAFVQRTNDIMMLLAGLKKKSDQ